MTATSRTPVRSALVLSALALALVGALADWYSVAHHLPYAVGGHGRPGEVGHDWPSHGTALGPPLLPFVVLAVGVLLASSRRWWGAVGDLLLVLVAAAELFGTVAEPSFRHVLTPGGFDAVQVLFRLVTLVAAIGLAVTGGLDLRARRTDRRAPAIA